MRTAPLPWEITHALRTSGQVPTRWVLLVSVADQAQLLLERAPGAPCPSRPLYQPRERHRISTSAYGVGPLEGSNATPLGLHRIAVRIGGGWPPGTAFKGRRPIGLMWKGLPHATILHRILWLEGLEPGRNRGGSVDSFRRYIYIHGFYDESTLGRPASHGCIHMAVNDLIPLFERIPTGSLVWITDRHLPARFAR